MLLAASTAGEATAQDGFTPFPGGSTQYRVNLERLFFPTPEAELAARRTLLERARRLQSEHPAATSSARELERLALAVDSVQRVVGKHLAYLTLRSNVDTRDVAASTAANAFGDSIGRALGFVAPALAALSDSTLQRFVRERPGLGRFAFAIRRAMRARPAAGASVAAAMSRWQPALFWSLYGETDWGRVQAPEGTLDVARQGSRIANHPDRAVREAGYRSNLRGRMLHRGSYAQIVRENVISRNALAELRGFRDFREESYGERFLTTDEVARTLREIAARGHVNKRYERARVGHLRATHGLDSVHVWDLALPEAGMRAPRFTVPEASDLLRRSHLPLGPDYARELNLLLDPRNGRLDLEPREGRSPRPGFSTGSVGYPSVFFQGRYEGYLGDVVIFAHEIGHGVQNGLMDANGVLATNAGGPAYFTESFAGFTELLLADYMYRTATERSEKIFYLQAFLDRAAGLFDNARAADFEHTLYDSIPAGWALDADALDRLTQGIGSRYSIWYEQSEERKDQWNNTILYFTRPLYSLNYMYANLLALKYLADFQRDQAAFVERYAALLANGYDDEPSALLRRFVGIDLQGTELVGDAVRVIESRLAELERLYASP